MVELTIHPSVRSASPAAAVSKTLFTGADGVGKVDIVAAYRLAHILTALWRFTERSLTIRSESGRTEFSRRTLEISGTLEPPQTTGAAPFTFATADLDTFLFLKIL